MSENNYHKVSSWKLILVLMLIVWMINVLMSFVYKTQPNFFMFTWLTNIFLCLVSIICYVFYLLFFKHRNRDKEEDNDAQ